jgi:hypothetical protein
LLAIAMTTLTLMAKISIGRQLRQIDKFLEHAFEGVKVETKILGVLAGRWAQLSLTGEDEGVATSYIMKEIGICPTTVENLSEASVLKGYITNLAKSKVELSVDIGVFKPEIVHATVPLRCLQSQLVDGRKVALKKIAELFGFCDGIPIYVKVTQLNGGETPLEAKLAENQKSVYANWRESLLDRLLVLGPAVQEVNRALDRAQLHRDVIYVETLGLFEHALTCKLGTDAAGLIPKIGRSLKTAKFAVFNSKRLEQFLNLS